jgi:uncharacterized protein
MQDFQRYQIAFTAHIRNPHANKKPVGVVDARMAVYREIVFTNLVNSVSTCFPVCRQILGNTAWEILVRQFFSQHQATTPLFREIPQQLVQFMQSREENPLFIKQLAHYEWVELAVASLPTATQKLSKATNLMQEVPIFAPHMLLEYDFAVHQISKKNQPKANPKSNAKSNPKLSEKTYLLVYRNVDFVVKFIELNAMTFQLLNIIEQNNMPAEPALMRLAEHVPQLAPEIILKFGAETLQDLVNQGAILGSYKVVVM